MLRLLGKPASINVRKVLWTCAALDLPYRLEPWGSGTANTCADPAFLTLNPNAMVPVLVDGDTVLWESNTICRYLASAYGQGRLLPAAAPARAQVEMWMDWQIAELNAAWRYAFMALVRNSPAHTGAPAIAASAAAWNAHMALLDRHLAHGGDHVAGAAFSLADLVLALSTNRWLSTPMERPDLPAVRRWYDGLAAQPGFMAHCANGIP